MFRFDGRAAGVLRKFKWTVSVLRAGRAVYPYAFYPTKYRARKLSLYLRCERPGEGPFRVTRVPDPGL